MKKFLSKSILVAALLGASLLAFVNGPQDGTTPWTTPTPGAVYLTFNVQGDTAVYQKLNDSSPTPRRINVSTLKIGEIILSQEYAAVGAVLTVSYTVENTGDTTIANITPVVNFFKTAIDGTAENSNFQVTPLTPYALSAGASKTNVFRVTVSNMSPGDNYIVDGELTSPAGGPRDRSWQNGNILSNAWQSGAALTKNLKALTAAVTVNNGAEFTGSRVVNLGLSITPALTPMYVQIRDNGGAYSAVTPYAAALSYTLVSAGDGEKTVEVRFTNAAGSIVYATVSDSIKLDTTKPAVVAEKGKKPTSNVAAPNLDWSPASDPLSGGVASGVSTYNIYWGPLANGESPLTAIAAVGNPSYSAPAISGRPIETIYYLRIQTVDRVGNASNWQTVWIYPFDDVRPSGRVTINAGAEYTSNNAVTLELNYSPDVESMNITGTDGNSPSGIIAARPQYPWTFGAVDGEKTVTVTYYDSVGNTFNAADKIKLDRTVPGVVAARGTLPVSNNLTPVFNWTPINDPVVNGVASGVSTYNIYFGESPNGEIITASVPASSAVYAPTLAGKFAATFYLRVQSVDAVGNKSGWNTVWIYPFNNLPPTGAVTINAGNPEYTNANNVTLYLSYAANVVSMNITDGNTTSGLIAMSPTLPWTFAASDGEKTVTVTYYDAIGNAAAVTDMIKLDMTLPNAVIYAGKQATSNLANPVLSWTAAVDPLSGGVASGVSTYNVYWGASSAGAAPYTAQPAADLNYAAALNPVPSRNETYYLRIQTIDAAGNAGGWNTVWEYPFDNLPPTGAVTINGGAQYATSNSVTLDLSYAADVVSMNITDTDGNTSGLLAVSPVLPWTFSAVDGEKTVTVTYYDFAGNTVVAADKIILDTMPPTGSVTINGGAEYTSNNAVILELNYSLDVVSMNIEGTDGNLPSGIIAVQQQYPWLFAAVDGEKTVTVTYYDRAGNTANAVDTIILDTMPPTGSVTINGGAEYTSNNAVTLTLDYSLDVVSMNITDTDGNTSGFLAVSPTLPWTFAAVDGEKTVTVTYYDAIGNAAAVTDTIKLDLTSPNAVIYAGKQATSNLTTLVLNWTAAVDPLSGGVASGVSTYNVYWGTSSAGAAPYTAQPAADLDYAATINPVPSRNETYYLRIQTIDAAGNAGGWTTVWEYPFDNLPPTGSVTINGGTEYTSNNAVILELNYSLDVVSMNIEDTDGNTSGGLIAVSPVLPWIFATVDGEKTVTVSYYDRAGNTVDAADKIILDTVSPNLVSVNQFTLAPAISDFELRLEFSEAMDTATMPSLSIVADIGAAPISDYRGWSNSSSTSNNIYTFALDLTAVGGQITVNLLAAPDSARDRAGNIVNASPNFAVFYVDSIRPTGGVTLNNGEIATSNPLVEVALEVWDDRSVSADLEFMILAAPSSPASDVSGNPGITLNIWLPYQPTFSVNLSAGVGSKNIYVVFKDKSGNTSNVYSDDIFLDSDEILWLAPTSAAIVSGDVEIKVQLVLTRNVSALDFYVSANGGLWLVSQNVPDAAGLSGALWDTLDAANPYSLSARDVELLAVISKNGSRITANPVNLVTVDNTTPSITLLAPWPDLRHVMAGTVTINGIATDNGTVTWVNQVEILVTSAVTADLRVSATVDAVGHWSYGGWSIADTVPVGTTFNISVWTYDAAGNRSSTASARVIRTDQVAIIEVSPPPTQNITWLNPAYEVTFNGTVDSSMTLTDNLLATFNSASKLAPLIPAGAGQWSWQVTFDITALSGVVTDNPGLTLEMLAETSPNGRIATQNFTYRVDGRAPTLSALNVTTPDYHAIGTLKITGNFTDDSGVSEVQVSLNGSILNFPADNFSLTLNVSANVVVTFRALDNAYPSPNASGWVTINLIYDTALLPSGAVTSPVSGSYVNNVMLVTGTATVKDGSSVAQVWLDFGAGWVTVNSLTQYAPTADWEYTWQVPTPNQDHGQVFTVSMSVLSARGMQAEVSPQPVARYVKDIYGPTANFLNLANGIFLTQTPFQTLAQTYTEGAWVSAAYFIVDGVTESVMAAGGSLNTANVSWNYSWNWDGKTHEVKLRVVDRVNNWTETPTLSVRSTADITTEPLPPGGILVLPGNGGVFATSRNYVLVTASVDLTAYTIQAAPAGVATPTFTVFPPPVKDSSNNYIVTYNSLGDEEIIYLLNFVSTNGAVEFQQLVMYDISAPQVSYNALTSSKYYPDAWIAPEQVFEFLVIDRVYNGAEYTDRKGSGFTAAPSFNLISSANLNAAGANTILRSVFASGATLNAVNKFKKESFTPQDEKLTFQAALSPSGVYDVAIYAVDNAGNAMNVNLDAFLRANNKLEILDAAAVTRNAFIVNRLRVGSTASGESGGLDKSKFITAYPNPYNPEERDVLFTYYLKDNAQKARIMIYNQLGEMLHMITVNGPGQEGTRVGYNAVPWDGLDRFDRIVSNGVYIYLIVIDGDRGQTSAKGTMAVIKQ
jgi:hypothetical protein